MKTSGKKESKIEELKRIFYKLRRKYLYSVHSSEREDLEQTIWYLMLLAMKKYDPKRGTLQNFAYYFSDQKLKDHFWRGANLPETKGSFTLLHLKAALVEDDNSLPKAEASNEEKIEELPNFLLLKIEGYTLVEIAKKLEMSYGSVERKWKKYVKRVKESRQI
ncbi:hypothetical protein [Mesoaciditoga sp.]